MRTLPARVIVGAAADSDGIVYFYAYDKLVNVSVRDANFARDVLSHIAMDPIIEGNPMEQGNYIPLWNIDLSIHSVGRKCASVQVDYHRSHFCPLEQVAVMMDVYTALRRALRTASNR